MAAKVVLVVVLAVDLVLGLAGCNVSRERAVSKQESRSATEGKPVAEPLPSATPPSEQVAVFTGSSSNLNGPGPTATVSSIRSSKALCEKCAGSMRSSRARSSGT
jgi:hypothetical protein